MKKGLFIALEGIDGCGKSTQAKLLATSLQKEGHNIYATCEPTNNFIGTSIRNIFNHSIEADDRVIAALFAADRLDHLLNKKNGLLKKIEAGFTVITDRYYFSSYAYHSVHMPMDWVIATNALSAALLKPDLTIYIDIPAEVSMERIAKGRNTTELYENLENLNKVRNKYFEAFEVLKIEEKVSIFDGNKPQEILANDILDEVNKIINK